MVRSQGKLIDKVFTLLENSSEKSLVSSSSTAIITQNTVSSAATKTALVVAAGTGSFYQQWGSDLAAAIIYNIDGANQYTWIAEGSRFVPKDANDVFNYYFGLTLNVKRIFYWSVGGPGNDPSNCFLSAEATADFIRGLDSTDPVFPFHIFVLFTGKDLHGPGGLPWDDVLGCVVEVGNFKYVRTPNDLPTTSSVPVAVVESPTSSSGHLRRYTTAHEIGHILGGDHDKAGTVTLVDWLFGDTGTRCDGLFNTPFFLYAHTLMSRGYSGSVVCLYGWIYSDFFISESNKQVMGGVINNVFN